MFVISKALYRRYKAAAMFWFVILIFLMVYLAYCLIGVCAEYNPIYAIFMPDAPQEIPYIVQMVIATVVAIIVAMCMHFSKEALGKYEKKKGILDEINEQRDKLPSLHKEGGVVSYSSDGRYGRRTVEIKYFGDDIYTVTAISIDDSGNSRTDEIAYFFNKDTFVTTVRVFVATEYGIDFDESHAMEILLKTLQNAVKFGEVGQSKKKPVKLVASVRRLFSH